MNKKIKKPTYHVLVCNSYRTAADSQGACNKRGSTEILQYIMEEANDRNLDVAVATTGCLNVCAHKPVIVVHPHNHWYGGVTEEAIDEILDGLEEGKPAERFLISE